MLTATRLRALSNTLRDRKVLSVFIDLAANEAEYDHRDWRYDVHRAVARLRSSTCLEPRERTARDLAVAHLLSLVETMREPPQGPAWVAYATTDDVVAHGTVRTRVVTLASWRDGPMIGPLLPALVDPAVVAVAIADRRNARVYSWRRGMLSEPEEVTAEGGARDAMLHETARRAAALAGPEGHIVVGGTPDVARLLVRDIERMTGCDAEIAPALTMWSGPGDIAQSAENRARTVRLRLNRAILADVPVETTVARDASAVVYTPPVRAFVGNDRRLQPWFRA
jgi:hypothetical protein